MKVIIWWESDQANDLIFKVRWVLEELGLTDFVQVENTSDKTIQSELWIKEDSALVIEEESIDFKDMIFEWILPADEELKSMFISIIWGGSTGWDCGVKWPDGTCGSGCSC